MVIPSGGSKIYLVDLTAFTHFFLGGINECLEDNGGCEQLCIDTYDSYYCGCNHGYRVVNGYRNCVEGGEF